MSLLYILTADVLRIISSMYTVEGDFIAFKSYSKRAVLGVVRNALPRLSSRECHSVENFPVSTGRYCFLIRPREGNHARNGIK